MRKDLISLAAESERGLVGRGAVVPLSKRVGSAGKDPGGVKVELNRALERRDEGLPLQQMLYSVQTAEEWLRSGAARASLGNA